MIYDKTLGIFTVKKVSFFEGEYYTYGGFGSYLSEIRKYFRKTILLAHVKECKPAEGYYKITREDLEVVHLLQSRNELENLLQLPYNFYKSIEPMNRMDIVHCRMPDYTGIIGVILARLKKKEFFIQTIADWGIEARKTNVFKKKGLGLFLKFDYYCYDFLERIVSKKRLVFAQGYTCYEKHKKHAYVKLISSTAHYNADIGTIKKRFQKKNIVNLLHIGRLTGIKNQELLINALSKLNEDTDCEWNLNILGQGPLKEKLNKQIIDLKLTERVFLKGQINRGLEFWSFFENSDAFLMSSRSEGTPKVLLEAMATSVPVVATNVGGIPYMAPHLERGVLYEDNNVIELVESLKMLKANSHLQDKIIQKGMQFARENTLENATKFMVEEVSSFFKWQKK